MSQRTSIAAVVVDDEALAREELTYLLKDHGEMEVIATAANGLEAVEVIEKMEPDLVFLDVQMPGLDGLGVVRQLQQKKVPLPYFVFTTAFDQYAVEAFRLEAMDYLLKPIDKERLQMTVERARKALEEKLRAAESPAPARPGPVRSKLLLKVGARNLIVDSAEVIYATIDEGLITLVTSQFEGESNYRTIEELQSNLDPEIFWRVHRSYLVNINRIKEVIPWFKSSFQIRMDDKKGTEIPVSRIQTKRLRELLKL
jgi:two-component system LytT family response regulator/two-component system response regulator LytT